MTSPTTLQGFLQPLSNALKRIPLKHKIPTIIGRDEQTQITDLLVSRKQLELTADCETNTVTVKTLGRSYSGCKGYALLKDESYLLNSGDLLEVRLGHHQYEVVFESQNGPPAKKKRIVDYFGTNSEKAGGHWEEVDNRALLIFTSEGCCNDRDAIAAFDMDGTLTVTRSGARFPKNNDDWVLKFANVQEKLRTLHANGYKVVILTNQAGLGTDAAKIGGFKTKIENITTKLKVPVQVFVATGKTIYRKPAPGMWRALQEKNTKAINMDKSFFVGDAAGRPKAWASGMKQDHSLVDRLFALNLKLPFHTPEEFFQNASSVSYSMPEFEPKNLSAQTFPTVKLDSKQVILMVGSPGSGKSHYCLKHLAAKNIAVVSRDQKGSWQKCVAEMEQYLKNGKSVVIDNTNPDKDSRGRFITIAKKYGVVCKCFVMDVSVKHAQHNNRFRQLTDTKHAFITDLIINAYFKSYQEPEMSEGFEEIVKIPFVPQFDSSEQEELYNMYLLEK